MASEVADPVGDQWFHDAALVAPPYADLIGASLTEESGNLVCRIYVDAPIPAAPVLQPGAFDMVWRAVFNTAPGSPSGFPAPEGMSPPGEYILDVRWDGRSWSAYLWDRIAMANGGPPIVVSSFSVVGNQVEVSLPRSRLAAASFTWFVATASARGNECNDQTQHPICWKTVWDRAPNQNLPQATYP